MTLQQLGQQTKLKYPQYQSMSDEQTGNLVLQKYPQYQSQIDQPQENKPFTYNVASSQLKRTPEINAQIKARLQSQLTQAQKQSKFANSPLGMLFNFGKSAGQQIASSEIGWGQTLGKALTPPTGIANNVANLTNDNIRLIRAIKTAEAQGKDATKLQQAYNSNVKMIEAQKGQLTDYEQSLPTNAQLAGQVGGTALDVATAGTYGKAALAMKSGKFYTKVPLIKALATPISPELGKLSEQTAAGLFTKKGAANIAKGAGIGYGYDVSQNLQQGKTGMEAAKPGIGTLLGGGIPAISEAGQSISNRFSKEGRALFAEQKAQKIINKQADEIQKIENNYAKTRKAQLFSKDANAGSRQRIAASDVLIGSVDENGLIRTKQSNGAVKRYKAATLDKSEAIVRQGLEREGATISLNNVEKLLTESVNNSGLEGAELKSGLNKIKKEIAGYRLKADAQGKIPITLIHDAKVSKNQGINWMTPPDERRYATAIQQGLKKIVEDNTSTFNVKAVNKEIGKYLQDIKLLESLDGARVKGGKLGKYFAESAGHISGAVAGGIVGGPIGSVAGFIGGGEITSRIKTAQMKGIFGKSAGLTVPKNQILEEAGQLFKSPRPMLPAPKPGAYPKEYGATGKPIILPAKMPLDQAAADAAYGRKLSAFPIRKIQAARELKISNFPVQIKRTVVNKK